jgi:hypothetical protein
MENINFNATFSQEKKFSQQKQGHIIIPGLTDALEPPDHVALLPIFVCGLINLLPAPKLAANMRTAVKINRSWYRRPPPQSLVTGYPLCTKEVLMNPEAMMAEPLMQERIEKISIDCSLFFSFPTVAADIRGRKTAKLPLENPIAKEKSINDQKLLAKPQMHRTQAVAPSVEISIGK